MLSKPSERLTGRRPSVRLQVFRALLHDDGPAAVGDADAVVWAYLQTVPGLRAQIEAMDVLWRETAALQGTSAFRPHLLDTLDRHRLRLGTAARLKLVPAVVAPSYANVMARLPKSPFIVRRPSPSRVLPVVGSFHG